MSKSPSLRRIQADIRELAHDPSERYHASPLENDMFEWYVLTVYRSIECTMRIILLTPYAFYARPCSL
jgi:ubiquitin-protein ligase